MTGKWKETATNSSHGGGSDHFPPGFLGLSDLIIFVIKILKHKEYGCNIRTLKYKGPLHFYLHIFKLNIEKELLE